MKSEARRPKAERRPSSEIRRPKPEAERGSSFGLRVSELTRYDPRLDLSSYSALSVVYGFPEGFSAAGEQIPLLQGREARHLRLKKSCRKYSTAKVPRHPERACLPDSARLCVLTPFALCVSSGFEVCKFSGPVKGGGKGLHPPRGGRRHAGIPQR